MIIVDILIMALLLALVVGSGLAMYRLVVVPARKTTRYVLDKSFVPGEVIRTQPLTRFLGLESIGGGDQPLGTLVLTANRLWFHKSGDTDAVLDIQLAAVEEVEIVRRHLGTETGRPLLSVRFSGAAGTDRVAFHLPFPEQWRMAIDNLRST